MDTPKTSAAPLPSIPPRGAAGDAATFVPYPPTLPHAALGPTLILDGGARPLSPAAVDPFPVPLNDEGFGARYAVRAQLGAGGMGEVRLCHDERIGRDVAMKVIRRGQGSSSDLPLRFVREARIQGQLEHPSVVPVYDLGLDPAGAAYFTMKRVRGLTLGEVVDGLRAGDEKITRRFARRKLLGAFQSVCLAVDFAHSRGVIHRDLKPPNVMLGDFGEVYVLDWGIARVAGMPEDPAHSDDDSSATIVGFTMAENRTHTARGSVMGTPGYMAPEHIRGERERHDARADVYALGAILFELLTLELLHPGETAEQAIASTLAGATARPSDRAPAREVPPELEAICIKATAFDPENRFPSARALHDAIEQFLDGDRDLALRRDLASQHAAAAAAAAEQAFAGDDEGRHRALQEVGRALALDPSHPGAIRTMVRLLTEPPKALPPEARVASARSGEKGFRAANRTAAGVYLSWLILFPLFFLWLGVRDWATSLCAVALMGLASLVAATQTGRPGRVRNLQEAALWVSSTLGILFVSRHFGPLLLVPSFLAANTLGFALTRRRSRRIFFITAGCLALAIPMVLEATGVLAPSYVFHDGAMTLVPHATNLPRVPTLVFLTLANMAVIAGAALYIARVRSALSGAERRLQMQAWQLGRLVPDEARGAVAAKPDAPNSANRAG